MKILQLLISIQKRKNKVISLDEENDKEEVVEVKVCFGGKKIKKKKVDKNSKNKNKEKTK